MIDISLQNYYLRQTFMSPPGFEHVIPAREQPQTHTLERAANG